MKVYISYSAMRSVEYCFWKYFFEVCGIWVSEEIITEDWEMDKTKVPQLVIMDKKDETNYLEQSPRIVYCVRKSANMPRTRKDIVRMEWWKKYYYSVLVELFRGDRDLDCLMRLMGIFAGEINADLKVKTEEGLWSATWLFHELAQSAEKKEWDRQIRDKAMETIETLLNTTEDILKSSYCQYAILYCKYLQCGVNRSSINRMNQTKELLIECEKLADKMGWTPALLFLAGKMSLLTSAENKYAVNYFDRIIKYEARADLLYEIGHIYEKAYGNVKRAWEYYQLAYRQEPDYYRALYKLAVKLETEDRWMQAISVYNRVRKIVAKKEKYDSISVRELEYEYKSCKNILRICRRYIDDYELQNSYRLRIRDMNQNTFNYIRLDKLIKKMFLKENQAQKKEEILEELQKKINFVCCN